MIPSSIQIYQNAEGQIKLDVCLEDETVWLTQEQMATLFGKGRSTITEHIRNVFEEGELEQNRTCRNFRQVRQEGARTVERDIEHYNRDVGIPKKYNRQALTSKKGAELEVLYVELLRELGKQKGMLGQIFTKAQNKIQDPAKLYRLIDMIDSTQWLMMGADVKGDIYEGLLEKNAEDTYEKWRSGVNTSPDVWLNMQTKLDLWEIVQKKPQQKFWKKIKSFAWLQAHAAMKIA